MKLVDLTKTLDPRDREGLPDIMKPLARVVAPNIEFLHPAEDGGKAEFCSALQCSHDDLPDGEGWGAEILTDMSSHCGTHVDAPLHSGSRCEGKPSRTITDIDLSELFRPGLVLDLRPWTKPGQEITIGMLDEALDATGCKIQEGSAVILRTGQEDYNVGDPGYFNYPGMTRASTLHLTQQGATILGTDSVGWDLPMPVMNQRFRETGDKSFLWDGHKAIAEREAFIVQQMCNLEALPSHGFMIGCFPLKLSNCSAAPARVVAFLDGTAP